MNGKSSFFDQIVSDTEVDIQKKKKTIDIRMPRNYEEDLKKELVKLEEEKEQWEKTNKKQQREINDNGLIIAEFTKHFKEQEGSIAKLEEQEKKDLTTIKELIATIKQLRTEASTDKEDINKLTEDKNNLTNENIQLKSYKKEIEKENYSKQIKDKNQTIQGLVDNYKTLNDNYVRQGEQLGNQLNEVKNILRGEKENSQGLINEIIRLRDKEEQQNNLIADLKQELKSA